HPPVDPSGGDAMHHRRSRLRRGGGGTAQSADRTGESWGCDCGGFLAEPLPLFPLSPLPPPPAGHGELCPPVPSLPSARRCPSPAEGKGELCRSVPMAPPDPDCPSPLAGEGWGEGATGGNQTLPPCKHALSLSAASAEFSCMNHRPPRSDSTVTMGLRPA